MEMNCEIRPAIIAIGYNRPNSLQRLLKSIGDARYDYEGITLVISIDRSDVADAVIDVAQRFEWGHGQKVIRTFEERQGLRSHILQCGDLSEQYGAVIVLEDDIVVSPEFYNYTVEALAFYKDKEKIAGVALYSHKYNGYAKKLFEPVHKGFDTYMGQFGVSWGQCWSAVQWKGFKEWYEIHKDSGLNYHENIPSAVTKWPETSWGKYFVHYIVECDKYYVMPYEALATCFADVGQHVLRSNSTHQVPLLMGRRKYRFASFDEAEKYDIFFESVTLKQYFPSEIADDLCVDLYNLLGRVSRNRYLLRSTEEPYKKIGSYGMMMKPKELNIRYAIAGDDIFLYDTQIYSKKEKSSVGKNIYYESYGMEWKTAMRYGILEFCRRLKKKILK